VEDFGAVGEKFETEDRKTKVVCGGIKMRWKTMKENKNMKIDRMLSCYPPAGL